MNNLSPRRKLWLKHIQNQQTSGLSQSSYCKIHQLNVKSFSSNKSQLAKYIPMEEISENQNIFIPLVSNKRSDSFSIKLNSGIELIFEELPDPNWMSKLLSEMSSNNAPS